MRGAARVVLLAAALAALIIVTAAPAVGTITEVAGNCTGSGNFDPGGMKDANSAEVTIPKKATVTWTGAVVKPMPTSPRKVDGFVKLKLPMGQDVTLGTWPSSGVEVDNRGVYEYDLPSVIAGFDMTFYGEHYEEDALWCTGEVTVRVEGSNPLGIPSVALFVVSVVGVSLSIRARDGAETIIHEITPGEPYDV